MGPFEGALADIGQYGPYPHYLCDYSVMTEDEENISFTFHGDNGNPHVMISSEDGTTFCERVPYFAFMQIVQLLEDDYKRSRKFDEFLKERKNKLAESSK